jgi:hypothetical protein
MAPRAKPFGKRENGVGILKKIQDVRPREAGISAMIADEKIENSARQCFLVQERRVDAGHRIGHEIFLEIIKCSVPPHAEPKVPILDMLSLILASRHRDIFSEEHCSVAERICEKRFPPDLLIRFFFEIAELLRAFGIHDDDAAAHHDAAVLALHKVHLLFQFAGVDPIIVVIEPGNVFPFRKVDAAVQRARNAELAEFVLLFMRLYLICKFIQDARRVVR